MSYGTDIAHRLPNDVHVDLPEDENHQSHGKLFCINYQLTYQIFPSTKVTCSSTLLGITAKPCMKQVLVTRND